MRILLVEDEVKLARLIRQVLEEEIHTVEVATDGRLGLELAQNGGLDLLILDWMLPGLSGVELCRTLRQERNNVPVLMLTARDAIEDRVQGLDAGADDYLVKPFAFEELLARVRALARRAYSENLTDALLQVADLTLDLRRHEVTRNRNKIELTVKEFDLLEYLMRNTGRVLTRDQIFDYLWHDADDITSNVVDIYIHYLRGKIDQNFTPRLIKTIRGVGYTLRTD